MHKVVVFSFGKFKSRKCLISFSRDYVRNGQKNKKALKNQGFLWLYLFYSPFLVEATGLEPTTFWSLTKRATKLRYASIFAVRHPNSITIIPILSLLVKHFFTHF